VNVARFVPVLACAALVPVLLLARTPAAPAGAAARAVSYGRDVRPILASHCLQCHGQDPAKRQAELRLDVETSAKAARDGVTAIVAGSVEASDAWRRVTSDDAKLVMPPPDSHKPALNATELATLRAWIEAGATYEPHWAFVPPRRPPLPDLAPAANAATAATAASAASAMAPTDAALAEWPRNAVDHFVLEKLVEHGLRPSPQADGSTLTRRLYLDLTGLPPTPEELDAFLADARPDAYEQLVDRLLTQEPYLTRHAERMASPWLDAARYADTSGIHTDAGRSIWPWRDWVLVAFRDNKPFDQFLTEQLAGDLLPDATQEQVVASGFNRNHVTTDEGGAIAEEYLVEYAVDRVATTGSVFMGLTWGCARCHDHKFDPLTQQEFYGLYSFFNSIEEPGLYSQEVDNKRAFEPFLSVPSAEQQAEQLALTAQVEAARAALDEPAPADDARFDEFLAQLPARTGLDWEALTTLSASSSGGATLTVQPDGSVLASGSNPDTDEHTLVLRTDAAGLRMLRLEALTDATLGNGRVGRAENGNAVLTGIAVTVRSLSHPDDIRPLHFTWAWADHEQPDGDFGILGALPLGAPQSPAASAAASAAPDAPLTSAGWALDGHRRTDGRVALLLADAPFGAEGGSELTVTLQYRSVYAKHVLGRVRLGAARLSDEGAASLPVARSAFHLVGPFPTDSGAAAYALAAGPETDTLIDPQRNFGAGNQYWTYAPDVSESVLNKLSAGTGAIFVGRRIWSPTARTLALSLGSDDGLQLYLDGALVLDRQVDRSLSADQDSVTLNLHAGLNALVAKVVNTGGDAGYYHRTLPEDGALGGDVALALLPAELRTGDLDARLRQAWRIAFSPTFRERSEQLAALKSREAELTREIPRTMVMRELAMPRPTFLLQRGQYEHPDPARPVTRSVPAVYGAWPADAPADRRGLAQWLLAPDNPLTARVAVNRLWELVFGTGLVGSSEDFGLQGESPSHPELLDWLAVELRENGWDQRALLRLIVSSATYRQSSRSRPELRDADPDNRLLAVFPRRRLTAEQIRDEALFVSGLLVEQLGGPSVKPYQPDDLWQEVAMPASNTRLYERGMGNDLWRRSLYTYWKRACPPPSLMTLDAPTRETCTVRRATTNTPLQALVLWNDEQFVEAARVLAQRTLAAPGDDGSRLAELFRRCTGRLPDQGEAAALAGTLAGFRERYAAAPADADALLEAGEAPVPMELVPALASPAELAAWTLLANAVLSLDATLSRS